MTPQEVHQTLLGRFGADVVVEFKGEACDPWIEVASESIATVCDFLKNEPALAFDQLSNLTGVDYLETNPKLIAKFPYEPHIQVVYHLYSIRLKHRLVVKAKLPRWKNDTPGELPEIPTVSHIWGIANWHEREAFDLVGIHFRGHPNLVRILCADDWEGYPLRKDYEQGLEYHGVRTR